MNVLMYVSEVVHDITEAPHGPHGHASRKLRPRALWPEMWSPDFMIRAPAQGAPSNNRRQARAWKHLGTHWCS